MDQVVFFSREIDAELVTEALPEVAVSTVYARRTLVEAILANAQLIGAVVEPDASDDWPAFLASIRRSFPLIPLLVLSDACTDGYTCVDPELPREQLVRVMADFHSAPRPTERRRYHRYEWPLRATIAGSSTVHRIHEISAGGAFLEPVSPIPEPRTECEIQIRFQNFTMTTNCEILDPRHVSSRAAPGFGVRFTALSGTAEEFIDSVVTDALARVLLDPTSVPEVPSIDEEEDRKVVDSPFAVVNADDFYGRDAYKTLHAYLAALAAGMGSRYGGVKQIDAVGPNGEAIIDYSIFDALSVGFTNLCFVVRAEIEDAVREFFAGKFPDTIGVSYAVQSLEDLPDGLGRSSTRPLPW